MKKIAAIGAGIAGVGFLAAGILLKIKDHSSVSVIGGADGPTSIFIAGKVDTGGLAVLCAVIAVLLILSGVWIMRKGEKRLKMRSRGYPFP